MQTLHATFKKNKRKCKIWWLLFSEEAKAPIFDRTGLLQFLAFPFSLYLTFSKEGLKMAMTQISDSLTFVEAFFWAIPLYLVFCGIKAMFCVRRKEKEMGQWVGNEFIYNKPKLLLTSKVTNEHNNKPITFKISDAEAGGYVYLRIEKDGWDTNVKTSVIRDCEQVMEPYWDRLTPNHNFMCLLTPKSKNFHLLTMKENQNPAIIRVYMLSFSI